MVLSEHQLNLAAEKLCELRGWDHRIYLAQARGQILDLQQIYLAVEFAMSDNRDPSKPLEK